MICNRRLLFTSSEPWSQLVDPILRQSTFHKLVNILGPVTKSREPVFNLVSKFKALSWKGF